MPIAITPNQTWKYICAADRNLPADQQTVFSLRALSKDERHALLNMLTSRELTKDETVLRRGLEGTTRSQVVRAGLIGWTNFLDASGKPVAFTFTTEPQTVLGQARVVPTTACLEVLTDALELELYDELVKGSNLNHDDRKNSPSPQP